MFQTVLWVCLSDVLEKREGAFHIMWWPWKRVQLDGHPWLIEFWYPWISEQLHVSFHWSSSLFLHIHRHQSIEKEIVRVRLRSGDKHHLRKFADRKAQISSVSGTNAFLICAFRSANFLRWCLSPERNLTHTLFLFPIVFGINLIHFFCQWEEGRCSRKFYRLFCCFNLLSRHLTVRILERMRTVSKSARFLATKSVNSALFKRGETKVQILARKSEKPFANTKVQIFGKEKCKTHRQF